MIAFVWEGNTCTFKPNPNIIHGQMEEHVGRLVRWNLHSGDLITNEFPLEKAGVTYKMLIDGNCGKVAFLAYFFLFFLFFY